MTSLSSIASFLLPHIFGIAATPTPRINVTEADTHYTFTVLDRCGEVVERGDIRTTDNPAKIALKLGIDSKWYAVYGYRVWIHDTGLNNHHPWRFRLMERDGKVVARLIDPRPR